MSQYKTACRVLVQEGLVPLNYFPDMIPTQSASFAGMTGGGILALGAGLSAINLFMTAFAGGVAYALKAGALVVLQKQILPIGGPVIEAAQGVVLGSMVHESNPAKLLMHAGAQPLLSLLYQKAVGNKIVPTIHLLQAGKHDGAIKKAAVWVQDQLNDSSYVVCSLGVHALLHLGLASLSSS